MDHAANGRPGAPVASVEMLGAFGDWRIFVHPAVAIGLVLACWYAGIPGLPVAAAALSLLPASLAGLAMTGRLSDALNPRSLWHAARGLGPYYAAPLLLMVALGVLWAFGPAHGLWWRPLFVLLNVLCLLCLYAGLGGAIHARRFNLDFEPALSPERMAEKQASAYSRTLQETLDAVYASTHVGNLAEGTRRLGDQLATGARNGRLAADVDQILRQTSAWNKDGAVLSVLELVVQRCIQAGQPAAALKATEAAIKRKPDFSPTLRSDRVILGEYARHIGRPALARRLLESCVERTPGV
jgi:hypothetical protein